MARYTQSDVEGTPANLSRRQQLWLWRLAQSAKQLGFLPTLYTAKRCDMLNEAVAIAVVDLGPRQDDQLVQSLARIELLATGRFFPESTCQASSSK